MFDAEYVIAIHDQIIEELGGLPGLASAGAGGVESALNRVASHAFYAGVDDVFLIAALYAVAIARGHVFNDANKRTGLTCALTYLERQDITISICPELEDIMVEVAEGRIDQEEMASILSSLWSNGRPSETE